MLYTQLSWVDRCCLARARLLALRAQTAAGGPPTTRQLRRAVEPMLGDLLPLPDPQEPELAPTSAPRGPRAECAPPPAGRAPDGDTQSRAQRFETVFKPARPPPPPPPATE